MTESFDSKPELMPTSVNIEKSLKERLKALKKSGKIKKFNLSLFIREKLEEYIREKEMI